jgi:hypothetical protein
VHVLGDHQHRERTLAGVLNLPRQPIEEGLSFLPVTNTTTNPNGTKTIFFQCVQ